MNFTEKKKDGDSDDANDLDNEDEEYQQLNNKRAANFN